MQVITGSLHNLLRGRDMYKLSQQDRAVVLNMELMGADDAKSRAAEARVQDKLLPIAGLDDGADDATRRAVLERTTAQQYRSFVNLHGSAFGDGDGDVMAGPTVPFGLDKSVVPA